MPAQEFNADSEAQRIEEGIYRIADACNINRKYAERGLDHDKLATELNSLTAQQLQDTLKAMISHEHWYNHVPVVEAPELDGKGNITHIDFRACGTDPLADFFPADIKIGVDIDRSNQR